MDAVFDWTHIDPEKLHAAQRANGLSDERLARMLGISTKTWWRYRTEGRIPNRFMLAVAELLEIDWEGPPPINILAGDESSMVISRQELRESIGVRVALLQRIAEATEDLAATMRRVEQGMREPPAELGSNSRPRAHRKRQGGPT